jgi:hypothetical protein
MKGIGRRVSTMSSNHRSNLRQILIESRQYESAQNGIDPGRLESS